MSIIGVKTQPPNNITFTDKKTQNHHQNLAQQNTLLQENKTNIKQKEKKTR